MSNSRDFLVPPEVVLPLTESECRDLLRSATFGRVGMTSGGLPAILPVRYSYDDGAITFGTGDGSKFRAAQSGDVLAFEIDSYDFETGAGWSVLALGRASVLTSEHDGAGVPPLDGARDGSARNHYVRLSCEMITGRRLARLE